MRVQLVKTARHHFRLRMIRNKPEFRAIRLRRKDPCRNIRDCAAPGVFQSGQLSSALDLRFWNGIRGERPLRHFKHPFGRFSSFFNFKNHCGFCGLYTFQR